MVTITRNDHYLLRINNKVVKGKVQKILNDLNLSDSDLNIAFESNKKLQDLKRTYLGINESTDVLSFKSGDISPESGRIFLGDIIISPKIAHFQAKENKHSFEIEILTLCIHGLLHLLDYDHSTFEDEQKMVAFQNKLLRKISG